MSNIPNKTSETLENSLARELKQLAKRENVDISGDEPADLFKHLIENLRAKSGQKVVVLIDEYDKPIIDHLFDIPTAEANRMVIRGFYGVLKSMDPHLKFTFLTGVSKFAKTSVFSELNNLSDITMVEKYANICGIAADDLDKHFGEHIESLRPLRAFQNCDNIHDEIIRWYDGYSWDGKNKVINPFSLLSLFVQERFGTFWYASGNPKFLIDLIKKNPDEFLNLKTLEMTEQALDAADFNKLEEKPLLFQTGYLTVKEVVYNGVAPSYMLEMPNLEVGEAFSKNIVAIFTESGHSGADSFQFGMGRALRDGDLPKALGALRSLFASIPYNLHVDLEAYYHSIFYAVMSVLGFRMDAEVAVSKGRVDAVLELVDKVYVMEFKYERCPPDASDEHKRKLFEAALIDGMEQINGRGYHKKYEGSGKAVYRAAFAFLGRDDIEMRVE